MDRKPFNEMAAYKELMKLKDQLNSSGRPELTAERIKSMCLQGGDLHMFYSTELVTAEIVKKLADLAREAKAVEKMKMMQSGAVLNRIEGAPCENRRVMHTAMRDIYEMSQPPMQISPEDTQAIMQAKKDAKAQNDKLTQFLAEIEKRGITHMVQVGIGGSDLGPRAIAYALERYFLPNRQAHFIANVDPDDSALVMKGLPLDKTIALVVSKSGSTMETAVNEAMVREFFVKAGLDPNKHVVAITGEKSPMDDKSRYLEVFNMWDYVGGRYSVTSMVGAVMLQFLLGHQQFTEFMKGAVAMDKVALTEDPLQNLPLLSALLGIWNRNYMNCDTVAILPYSQALHRFAAHLQQCDMESNGKSSSKQNTKLDFETGPIIWGEPGTNGQHSFYQSIHQGTTIVPCEFIGFLESQMGQDLMYEDSTSQEKLLANLLAQSIGLYTGKPDHKHWNKNFPGGRPNRVIMAKKLTPYVMGQLLAYYENKIAFQGFIWDINSFDQEGVQLGKVMANAIVDRYRRNRNSSIATNPFPEADAYMQALKQIK